MKLQLKTLPTRRAAWASAFAVAAALSWVAATHAQSKGTTYALFQYATIVGSSNTPPADRHQHRGNQRHLDGEGAESRRQLLFSVHL